MRVFLFLLILVCGVWASVFEKLEEKLSEVKSVKVVFIQKTRYSWYPKPELSKGIFYATREGKFRIEYTYPDEVVIVSNGKEIIILNKVDREAIIDSVKNNTSPVIESLFFFSRPLGEVFTFIGEMEKGDLKVLILKPKSKDENVKEVFLEVDPDLEVRRVRVIDSEGTETTIEFMDVKKNFTPSEGLFRINIPPDVKVRRAGEL
ncbi:MAG: outer membrane lipoprotein carrier protein LolA [Aquificae bacterium]|nr:outer membrane lipoprotein carrier protein LolA [Aquificota bacterium]